MLCQNVVPSELEQHPDQHLQKVPQMLCKHEMLFQNVDQKDLNNISINFLCQKVEWNVVQAILTQHFDTTYVDPFVDPKWINMMLIAFKINSKRQKLWVSRRY